MLLFLCFYFVRGIIHKHQLRGNSYKDRIDTTVIVCSELALTLVILNQNFRVGIWVNRESV